MTVCLKKNHAGALKDDYYIASACAAGDTTLPANIQTIAQALGDNPAAVISGSSQNAGQPSGTIGAGPSALTVQPGDIPVIGPILGQGQKLASSVSDFLGLITNTTVLKGVFLLMLAGTLLFVGVKLLK